MRIIGTRAPGATPTIDLIDELSARPGVVGLDIASAYWDAGAFGYLRELAQVVDGPLRVVLWTAGGSRPSWEAARLLDDARIDLRFIDSPEGGGIFHAKVAGAVGVDGAWTCALVGSGNLTDAAMRRNVELGVQLGSDEHDAVSGLRGWFLEQHAAATPAGAIDWEHALRVVPATSEAAARNRIFAEAALAAPSPAGPIEPPRPAASIAR